MQVNDGLEPIGGLHYPWRVATPRFVVAFLTLAVGIVASAPAFAMTSADILAEGKQCYVDWDAKKKKTPEDLLPCVDNLARKLANAFQDMTTVDAAGGGCALVALYHVAQQTVLASRYHRLCTGDALATLKPGWQKWVREHHENLLLMTRSGEVAEAVVQVKGLASKTPWVLTYAEAQAGTPRPIKHRHLLGYGEGEWRVSHERAHAAGEPEATEPDGGWRWNFANLAARGHQCEQKPDSLAFDCKANPPPRPDPPAPPAGGDPPRPADQDSVPTPPPDGTAPSDAKGEPRPPAKSPEKQPKESAGKPTERPGATPPASPAEKPADKQKPPAPPPKDATPAKEEPPPPPPIAQITVAAGGLCTAVGGFLLVAAAEEQAAWMDKHYHVWATDPRSFGEQGAQLLRQRMAAAALLGMAAPLTGGVVAAQMGQYFGKRKWTAVGVGGAALVFGSVAAWSMSMRVGRELDAPRPSYPSNDEFLAVAGAAVAGAGAGLMGAALLLAPADSDSNTIHPHLGQARPRPWPTVTLAPSWAPFGAGVAVTGTF